MKNRLWIIGLIISLSLLLGACAEGVIPANLTAELAGLDSVEVEFSGGDAAASIDEIEITGILSVISDSSWTIAGQSFLITPDTEIDGALEAGDIVKVHAYLGDGGEVFAREIELAEDEDESDPDDDDSFEDELTELEESGHEIEFVGTVGSMDETTWTIAGREIVVNDATEIEGDITVGLLVKVHASFVDGEGLVAREIEGAEADDLDEDDMDEDDDLKFEGVVESIDEVSVVVDGTTFFFADFTEFEDEINVGDFVEIYFFDQDNQNIVREIELEDMDDDLEDQSAYYDDDDDDNDDDYDDDDDDDDHDDDDHDDDHEEQDDDDEEHDDD